MAAKQGTKHHAAKLDDRKVRAARRQYATGKYSVRQLAEKFGVARQTMNAALNRQTWTHVG